jgi:hypothetical protein
MKYNTEKEEVKMPEYGRNVQKMVEYLLTIKDKELLQKQAEVVVDVMGNLNPHLRDVPDFKHKLWDHLFVLSDYQLDIESPYPIPTKEDLNKKPNPLSYPSGNFRYRHYGRNIQRMVKHLESIENKEEQIEMAVVICNVMKNSYVQWNNKLVEDQIIINQFYQLSKIDITIPEDVTLISVRPKKNSKNSNRGSKSKR